MELARALIEILWVGAIVARFFAVFALIYRAVWREYPALILVMIAGSAKSLFLLSSLSLGTYTSAYWRAAPLEFVIQAAIALEAFLAVGRHYPRFRGFAWVVASLLAGLSALAIYGSTLAGTADGALAIPMLIYRHSAAFWLSFTCLSVLWYSLFDVPISRDAQAYLYGSLLFFATALIYTGILNTGGWIVATFASVVNSGGAIGYYMWWATNIKGRGEQLATVAAASVSE